MLNNEQIVNRIRKIATQNGQLSDAEICRRCKINNRSQLGHMTKVKTAPQLDTLDKFARGLGVRIEDLIYNRTDVDIEMSRYWDELSEYEKMETVVWIKMQLREKNKKKQSAAA